MICFITPPSPFLLDERVFVSLGVLKVAAVLERAGHRVEHMDLSGVKNYIEVIESYSGEATTFGITATSPQMPAAWEIGNALRKRGLKTILGGPHVTLVAAARRTGSMRAEGAWHKLTDCFDVLVTGDGEKAIFEALMTERGWVDADSPKLIHWNTSKDFDESPWPARHLVDVSSYNYFIDGERALSMIGQLGCPFRCTFCAGRDSPMLRQIRVRTSDNVVAELVHMYESYGIKGCMFLDDELNVNRKMVELMQGIRAAGDTLGIEWRLRGFLKSELFTEEQAEAMYAAGFRQLLIGFESGHPRILDNIQKNATVEDNTRCMEIARNHGLKVKALMSIGHAGESEETILAVRDWLLEVKPSDFDVTIITPYPGSPYYDKSLPNADGTWTYAAKSGDRLHMDDVDFTTEAQFYKGIPGSYVSHVWTDHIGPEGLITLRDKVEREVREKLNIPFYQTGTALQFEASMGMTPAILRSSA